MPPKWSILDRRSREDPSSRSHSHTNHKPHLNSTFVMAWRVHQFWSSCGLISVWSLVLDVMKKFVALAKIVRSQDLQNWRFLVAIISTDLTPKLTRRHDRPSIQQIHRNSPFSERTYSEGEALLIFLWYYMNQKRHGITLTGNSNKMSRYRQPPVPEPEMASLYRPNNNQQQPTNTDNLTP